MLSHVQYLRELLDLRVIDGLCWTDTRDMIADGAAKGAVDRQLLHECMAGTCHIRHDIKLWQLRGKMRNVDIASAAAVHWTDAFLVHDTQNKKNVL